MIFIEISKNLIGYRSENNFVELSNNFVGISSMINIIILQKVLIF